MNSVFGQESESTSTVPSLEEPSQLIAIAQDLSKLDILSNQKGNTLDFAERNLKSQSFYKSVFHPPDFV